MILIAVYCCRTLTHYIVADDYEQNSEDFHDHDHEDLVGHSSEDLVSHNSREIVIQQPSKKSGPHISDALLPLVHDYSGVSKTRDFGHFMPFSWVITHDFRPREDFDTL